MTVLSWNVVLRYVVILLAVMDYNTRLKVGIMGTKSSQNVRVQEGLLKKTPFAYVEREHPNIKATRLIVSCN